ncbi:MAG: MBL fold metallo-hydrolase [Pseudomonadota bacterium]
MAFDYVKTDKTDLLASAGGKGTGIALLWGDRVKVLGTSGSHVKVKARGKEGYVKKSDLGGKSLLEFYFIDVGQGDGVLIRTPDHRHVLVDGGFARKMQQTAKNAADFVDWKFVKDYGTKTISLDAVITSHNDADHYGGLWDLLSDDPEASAELDATNVTVDAFYHAGLSWWKKGSSRTLGEFTDTNDGQMWTQILGDRSDVQAALGPGSGRKLAGEWAKLFECVTRAKTSNGGSTPIRRLSHAQEFLPGFEPGNGGVAIKVLAPVEFKAGGKPVLRRYSGGDSKNTNGQSILLRVDYGRARILLTGDLNTASQAALLKDYAGKVQEFECDVAKACHHGSDDVSYKFLQAMRPAVTVISSGDNEGHDHPRPGIVAASATTGYLALQDDHIVSPLIYSTELARSHKFSKTALLEVAQKNSATLEVKGKALAGAKVTFPKKTGQEKAAWKTLDKALVLSGLVYGLVNVRTDGEKILCATMNESDQSWQIKTIKSRF